MTHMQSLRIKGYPPKLGAIGLLLHKGTPDGIRDKILANRSPIIAELLIEQEHFVIRNRKGNFATCDCGGIVEIHKYPQSRWVWWDCPKCEANGAMELTPSVTRKMELIDTGKCRIAGPYGTFTVTKVLDDPAAYNEPVWALSELYAIHHDSQEMKRMCYEVKVQTQGTMEVSDNE